MCLSLNLLFTFFQICGDLKLSQILKKFRYIQVQYHRIGENYELRHKNIQEGLKKLGFNLKWEYPFVWESWENTFFNS